MGYLAVETSWSVSAALTNVRRCSPKSKGNSLDAVFDEWHVEIDEQRKAMPRQFEIGHDLGLMNGQHVFHGLDLDDDSVINQYVKPKPGIETNAIVHNRKCHLARHIQTAFAKFVDQTHFIDALQQSGPSAL